MGYLAERGELSEGVRSKKIPHLDLEGVGHKERGEVTMADIE